MCQKTCCIKPKTAIIPKQCETKNVGIVSSAHFAIFHHFFYKIWHHYILFQILICDDVQLPTFWNIGFYSIKTSFHYFRSCIKTIIPIDKDVLPPPSSFWYFLDVTLLSHSVRSNSGLQQDDNCSKNLLMSFRQASSERNVSMLS